MRIGILSISKRYRRLTLKMVSKMCIQRCFQERGVSLIELMLVLGIVAILTLIGGEGLLAVAARQQTQAIVTELASELRFARQFAINHRVRVRVLVDVEGTRLRTERSDSADVAIREYDFSGKGLLIERVSGGPQIQFHPSGRSASATTLVLRDRQQRRRTLTVSFTGRVAIS
ncbi:MAG: GspH/FimT family pseudopilin [Nitrospiraceae bacterium]